MPEWQRTGSGQPTDISTPINFDNVVVHLYRSSVVMGDSKRVLMRLFYLTTLKTLLLYSPHFLHCRWHLHNNIA